MKEKLNIDQTAKFNMTKSSSENSSQDTLYSKSFANKTPLILNEARKRIDAALGLLKLKRSRKRL